ncbi:DegT/DnrJ/EryC1/StrS family aminotransferase [Paenibacillus koleovorans]|uniref:DegT/DnrJ/EryC1/StrS family aminotransferase n=1 Tax=Paenibacillus koleovorans TaxID=121608 RepID=UPI0013E2B535|nr:DegT/DnrJ/EryC1/StrS family aminotransferase [Paenibacillus koleovorans]
MSKLAIDGGTPARSKPLPPNYPGAVVLGQEEADFASKVIMSQSPFRYYSPDPQYAVEQLENRMSADLGVPYTLGVTSATAALVVSLKALGIGYGDKVIVPANTFLATPGAVVCCNAVPVFCDVDESLNLDPKALEQVYDDEVKAIIAVPILGNPVDMDPIMAFARSKDIPVIEDVAQSCGATYKGQPAGSIGTIGAFSFQMNKIITAGEGGAVVTRDVKLFERAVRYHDQGLMRHHTRYGIDSPDDQFAFVGQNYRMSDITGAVMVEQWKKLPSIVAAMRQCHDLIRDAVAEKFPEIQFRHCPDPDAGYIGSNLGIIMPTKEATAQFNKAIGAENIGMHILYAGLPAYRTPAIYNQRTADKDNFPFNYPFRKPVVYSDDLCPRAIDLIPRTTYLPISPVLTEQDVEEIIGGFIKVYAALRDRQLIGQ